MSGTVDRIQPLPVVSSAPAPLPPDRPADQFVSGVPLQILSTPAQTPPTLTAAPPPDGRGLAIICIDGLSYPSLKYALQAGLMPNLAHLLDQGGSHHPDERIEMGASGSLANLYFKSDPKQWQLEDVQARYPDLIEKLVANPDIDLVATRQQGATVVYGKTGAVVVQDQQARFYGDNVLADHGCPETTLAQQLDRLVHMPNSGDIIVFGRDLKNDQVVSFDQQPGSHGGIGGGQNHAIFLSPRDWNIDSSQITNSSQMYQVFRSKSPLDAQ